jgi:glycosyltransferase involved in cell wall biosynthesis
MNRCLKKAVFVQSIPYSPLEGRLAQYHGAIFAEKLREWGVDATKMVVGNPTKQIPTSPLLSISSPKQRVSPEFWREQAYDLVVLYGSEDIRNIPMMRAIKQGSPKTVLILKIHSAYGPFVQNFNGILKNMCVTYAKTRYGHWARGKDGAIPGSIVISLLKTMLQVIRMSSPLYKYDLLRVYEASDFFSFENMYVVEQAKNFFQYNKRPDLASKIVWLGYPVRDQFASITEQTTKKAASIISVANWKYSKDILLHAAAIALILQTNPKVHFTVIGANSRNLYDRIIKLVPDAAPQITQIEEVSNKDLPGYLLAAQVFMLCSFSEGNCSAVLEALCSGCSAALSSGIAVPCFKEFVEHDCGTQAASRSPTDMAAAVIKELSAWESGGRDPLAIKDRWSKTLVSNLCKHICRTAGFELPGDRMRSIE